MAPSFEPGRLLDWRFPVREERYSERDTILHALSVGIGARPEDPFDLRHCFEEGLVALPSLALVLASPGFWLKDPRTGVDWTRVLHGEQRLEIAKALPPSGHVASEMKVIDVIDKGPERGALVSSTRTLYDLATGDVLATMLSISICRSEGGFGGRNVRVDPPAVIPDRLPDLEDEVRTEPRSALLYRLNGDWNPLHADPRVARSAGFDHPILHGLATFGMVQVAILRRMSGDGDASLRAMAVRFAGPVYPGETLRVEMWKKDADVIFRCRCVERNAIVLDGGLARLSCSQA